MPGSFALSRANAGWRRAEIDAPISIQTTEQPTQRSKSRAEPDQVEPIQQANSKSNSSGSSNSCQLFPRSSTQAQLQHTSQPNPKGAPRALHPRYCYCCRCRRRRDRCPRGRRHSRYTRFQKDHVADKPLRFSPIARVAHCLVLSGNQPPGSRNRLQVSGRIATPQRRRRRWVASFFFLNNYADSSGGSSSLLLVPLLRGPNNNVVVMAVAALLVLGCAAAL